MCSGSHSYGLPVGQPVPLPDPDAPAIPSPSFQTVDNPSISHTLERTVGTSVQLQLTLYPNVREIEWSWHSETEKEGILVSWKLNTTPDWYELEEKYRSSFSLPGPAVLSIRNLTTEMSGWYTARIKFHTGKSQKEVFKLCVYEPIPHPQIVIHSSSNQAGWCNVSLECGTPGATEIWTVTWLSEGLPRELEEREALGPAPSSRNLSLSLPLSQLNGPLTCRVSNPVDEKNATLFLQNICLWKEPQTGTKDVKKEVSSCCGCPVPRRPPALQGPRGASRPCPYSATQRGALHRG
ncbi:uncharacterized protein LOC116576190 isoform X6 [Mustela erminea]|uniref:uncharacterized protein LOC116576190 isoform X6 n=1 Tax=Mustela erminea TaxID=36723 RepID=UPI001386624B|nr:uncharacterized protein LOC116576190 isoform X6 [Mustela erminea]